MSAFSLFPSLQIPLHFFYSPLLIIIQHLYNSICHAPCFMLAYGELSLLYRSHQYLNRTVNPERSKQMVSYHELLMKVFLPKAPNASDSFNSLFAWYVDLKHFKFVYSFEKVLSFKCCICNVFDEYICHMLQVFTFHSNLEQGLCVKIAASIIFSVHSPHQRKLGARHGEISCHCPIFSLPSTEKSFSI